MINWYVDRSYNSLSVDFHGVEIRNGRTSVVEPVELVIRTLDDSELGDVRPPAFSLGWEDAQSMFQNMWDQGYRPKGEVVSDMTFAAQEKHIQFAEDVARKLLDD